MAGLASEVARSTRASSTWPKPARPTLRDQQFSRVHAVAGITLGRLSACRCAKPAISVGRAIACVGYCVASFCAGRALRGKCPTLRNYVRASRWGQLREPDLLVASVYESDGMGLCGRGTGQSQHQDRAWNCYPKPKLPRDDLQATVPPTAAERRVSHDPEEHALRLMSSKVVCRVYVQMR